MEMRVFRWACFGIAVVAVVALGWMVNDLRTQVKRTTTTVNTSLPPILDNVKAGTATMAQLSKDIEQLRKLAGVTSAPRDRSLVVYANSVLAFLEKLDGHIGLRKKLFGSGLKQKRPISEWVSGARKEAVWLSLRSNSKRELLDRLCKNKFGSAWMLELPNAKPVELEAYLRQHHADSASLPK